MTDRFEAEHLGQGIDLIAPATNASDYGIMRGAFPPGMKIPLHTHDERETIYVLDGQVAVWVDDVWHQLAAGEVVDIPSNARHAIQNDTDKDVMLLAVTTGRLVQFFRDIRGPLRPMKATPDAESVALFMGKVGEYGYWFASPEENAAIGTPPRR